ESHTHQIEVVVGEGQLFGIAHQCGQHNAFVDQTITAHAQHGLVDVGVHHGAAGADLLGKGHGQVTRAAGDIQHLVAFLEVGHHDGVSLPGAVQTGRHQVVHDVVL